MGAAAAGALAAGLSTSRTRFSIGAAGKVLSGMYSSRGLLKDYS